MADRDDPASTRGTRTLTGTRPESDEDVRMARRAAASFGGGEPTIGDSIRRYLRRYGWRAYALPILVIVTVVALFTARNSPPPKAVAKAPVHVPTVTTSTTAPAAGDTIPLKSDAASGSAYKQALKVGELPAGGSYTKAGKGTFRVLKLTSQDSRKPVGSGTFYRYDIEVENGITGIDLTKFASMVQTVLSDKRSWSGHGARLQRVDSGAVSFRVSLTSSMTVRKYCGYDIPVETSCYAKAYSVAGLDVNRVVLNDSRWIRGASPYLGDLNAYRIYMINHEDGHALGHQHAHQCLPNGLAPTMMQQTFGLKSATTGKLCSANPWPYPPGAKGAPGAEQPDTAKNNEYNLFGSRD